MEMKYGGGGGSNTERKKKWVGRSLKDGKVQFMCQGLFFEKLTTNKF